MFRKAAEKLWELLERKGKVDRAERESGTEKISYILLTVSVTVLLSLAALLAESSSIYDGRWVTRPKTGEGEALLETTVTRLQTGEALPVTIGIDEVKLTGEAMDRLYEEAYEYVEKAVLGKNESANCVTSELNFVTSVPGTVMKVEWVDRCAEYIHSDGSIKKESITEPTVAELMVKLTYFDEERYRLFSVYLCPPESDEDFVKAAALAVEQRNRESPESETVELPETVEGESVAWKQKGTGTALAIAVIGTVAAAAIVPAMDAEKAKKQKKREEELLRDYPDIVSKLTLLLEAGMTVRGAFEKICTEAKSDSEAYKEMKITQGEIRMGNSEAGAYERFGTRIGLLPYKRLGTILSRNLRRGNRDMLPLLELEAKEAFAMRKERVRLKGEEAGTKLLIPMVGMMCIVIAVVVVPAFASFG